MTPSKVPIRAGFKAPRVARTDVRVNVSVASRTQSPCDTANSPAMNRASARPAASRSAFWNSTDRTVRLRRTRCQTSESAEPRAYQNGSFGPESSSGTDAPDPARSASTSARAPLAAWMAATRVVAPPNERTSRASADSGSSASTLRHRSRSVSSAAVSTSVDGSGPRPSRAARTSASVDAIAATTGTGRPSGSSSTSVRSTMSRYVVARRAPAASVRPRSIRLGADGRSTNGTSNSRNLDDAALASATSRSSSGALTDPPSSQAPTMPAASAWAFSVVSASRSAKLGGAGSGNSTRSVTMSRAIPSVRPMSREPSEPGSNGGSDGRMNSSCSPVETSLTRTPHTPANETRKPKTNIATTATQVLTAA